MKIIQFPKGLSQQYMGTVTNSLRGFTAFAAVSALASSPHLYIAPFSAIPPTSIGAFQSNSFLMSLEMFFVVLTKFRQHFCLQYF